MGFCFILLVFGGKMTNITIIYHLSIQNLNFWPRFAILEEKILFLFLEIYLQFSG